MLKVPTTWRLYTVFVYVTVLGFLFSDFICGWCLWFKASGTGWKNVVIGGNTWKQHLSSSSCVVEVKINILLDWIFRSRKRVLYSYDAIFASLSIMKVYHSIPIVIMWMKVMTPPGSVYRPAAVILRRLIYTSALQPLGSLPHLGTSYQGPALAGIFLFLRLQDSFATFVEPFDSPLNRTMWALRSSYVHIHCNSMRGNGYDLTSNKAIGARRTSRTIVIPKDEDKDWLKTK